MRSRRSLVPLVLAMTILGGCAKTIQVKVNLDASGNPVFDKTHHEMAFVNPGDRVAWTCQCPPDTEFTVADLHFVADLNHVDEFLLRYGDPKEIESEIQGLESLQRKLSVAERPAESAEAMSEQSRRIQETIALLTDLNSTLSPNEERNLFRESMQEQWDPEFVDGRARLRGPGRVAKGIGYGLWKFTWKVRLKGNPAAVDEWDPHIVGHEKTY